MENNKNNLLLVLSTLFVLAGSSCFAGTVLQQKMDAYLQACTAEDLFSGAVLVAKDGEIIFQKAYGKSDYNKDIVNACDTRFRIASMTKAFTAMAVLQLEQKGLLHVDDFLSAYLPDYPRGNEITLKMLLNSRSGIVDHTTLPDFNTSRRTELCPLEETIKTFKNLPLEFSPGTKFEYSNSNYILLGFIIEKVTQKPYAEVIKNQILEPLGMDSSGFEYYQREIENMAIGHKLEGIDIVPSEKRIMQNAHASGAIYSTVGDLYIWDRALYTDKLINKASVNMFLMLGPGQYSYGWGKTRIFGKDVLAHMGEMEGFRPNIVRFINDDACVIVLSNFEHCPVTRISEDIAAIIFGKSYKLPQNEISLEEVVKNYPDYVGTYQLKANLPVNITIEGNQLFCQAQGQVKFQLHPESPNTFFPRDFEAKIEFVRDEKRKVIELILYQSGHVVHAPKIK